MRPVAFTTLVILLAGCAATEPETALELTVATQPPSADDEPDVESTPEGSKPATGPLAEMTLALEEAERESERATRMEQELDRMRTSSKELTEALIKRTEERNGLRDELETVRVELRQTLARLIDAEMTRVRAEQELLRHQIELEERARLRREEASQ